MKITEVVGSADLRSPQAAEAGNSPPLEFRIETHGSHHGQQDNMLIAYRGGEEVGSIEYSVYRDQPQVQMISVPGPYRRQGIGTAMLKRLQQEYPGIEIQMTTPTMQGAALIGSMPHVETPNQEFHDLKARLEELRAQEAEYQKIADEVARNPTEEGREKFYAVVDQWNELNDRIYEIEDRLSNISASTRTFQ